MRNLKGSIESLLTTATLGERAFYLAVAIIGSIQILISAISGSVASLCMSDIIKIEIIAYLN